MLGPIVRNRRLISRFGQIAPGWFGVFCAVLLGSCVASSRFESRDSPTPGSEQSAQDKDEQRPDLDGLPPKFLDQLLEPLFESQDVIREAPQRWLQCRDFVVRATTMLGETRTTARRTLGAQHSFCVLSYAGFVGEDGAGCRVQQRSREWLLEAVAASSTTRDCGALCYEVAAAPGCERDNVPGETVAFTLEAGAARYARLPEQSHCWLASFTTADRAAPRGCFVLADAEGWLLGVQANTACTATCLAAPVVAERRFVHIPFTEEPAVRPVTDVFGCALAEISLDPGVGGASCGVRSGADGFDLFTTGSGPRRRCSAVCFSQQAESGP